MTGVQTCALPIYASVQIVDPEMAALNGGLGDYTGASLVITRQGGANADDVFGFDNGSTDYIATGGELQLGGSRFGTYTVSGGTLTITFDSSGTTADQDLVNQVLSSITYANTNTATSGTIALAWSFSDGSSTGVGAMSVQVQP